MIEVKNITKKFDDIIALDNVSATITEGQVFGLIGTNGAGKSTFLRMLSGVLKPDAGIVSVDGESVYDNEKIKSDIFYISDEQHFLSQSTPLDMMKYYKEFYKNYNVDRFIDLSDKFGLDVKRRISTFSKGMKKQVSVLIGICAGTKYMLCDETFDGLDPVMRQAVKSLFAGEIEDRNLTPIIASHNLRELEDICDHVGLLHRGGILFSKDINDLKGDIHKIQCVFKDGETRGKCLEILKPVTVEGRGSLYTFIVNGKYEEISKTLEEQNPVFYEMLPLSLEEIFINETKINGYDIKNLIV